MAVYVREIMNRELVTLDDGMSPAAALRTLLDSGLESAPVVDETGHPIGIAMAADLVIAVQLAPALRIRGPAIAVSALLPIREAARLIAELDVHALVVVGSGGAILGMVTSRDLLRALLGLPPHFSSKFPHLERGVVWTDIDPLDAEHVAAAPEAPGIFVLSTGGADQEERDVWVDDSTNGLRPDLDALVARPSDAPSALRDLLARRDVRFRCAVLADDGQRGRLAERLRTRIAQSSVGLGAH